MCFYIAIFYRHLPILKQSIRIINYRGPGVPDEPNKSMRMTPVSGKHVSDPHFCVDAMDCKDLRDGLFKILNMGPDIKWETMLLSKESQYSEAWSQSEGVRSLLQILRYIVVHLHSYIHTFLNSYILKFLHSCISKLLHFYTLILLHSCFLAFLHSYIIPIEL